jgi:hypothetical protein
VSSPPSTEDRVILDALESGMSYRGGTATNQNEDPAELVLGRLYTELMGLIPSELDPVAPPPAVKQRLLERVRRESGEVTPGVGTADASMAPVATHPRFAPHDGVGPGARSKLTQRLLAIAATVLLAVSAWSVYEVFDLRSRLAATARQVDGLTAERSDVVNALRAMVAEVPGQVDVCPLRPVGDQPEATGNLVMSMATDSWYLKARNLRPATDGRYVVWFLDAADRPLRRAVLDSAGDSVEMAMEGLPHGMEAATVTYEPGLSPGAEPPASPSGPRVLYGHRLEMDRI